MRSRQPAATLFVLVLFVTGIALGGAATDDPAEAAARAWLAAADTLNGAETWHISAEQWQQALSAARSPMGALKSRILASVSHRTSLPGVPDGEYAVMQYQAEFEHKANALETVTAARQSDGSWRVAGYFIQ